MVGIAPLEAVRYKITEAITANPISSNPTLVGHCEIRQIPGVKLGYKLYL